MRRKGVSPFTDRFTTAGSNLVVRVFCFFVSPGSVRSDGYILTACIITMWP